MTRRIIIEPEAEAEIVEAATWYESKQEGLALEFLDEVEAHIRQLPRRKLRPERTFPGLGLLVCDVGRWPYRFIIDETGDARYVIAFAHSRRQPGYWRTRRRPTP